MLQIASCSAFANPLTDPVTAMQHPGCTVLLFTWCFVWLFSPAITGTHAPEKIWPSGGSIMKLPSTQQHQLNCLLGLWAQSQEQINHCLGV